MIKVLSFVPRDPDGCAFYRGTGVLGELRRHNIWVQRFIGSLSWADLSEVDMAFMQRPYTTEHLNMAKFVKKMVPLWIDYDDLLFEVPQGNPSYFIFSADTTIRDNIVRTIELADIVTVSTNELRKQLSKYKDSAKIKVISNAYNDYRLSTDYAAEQRDYKTVLWRGTNSHVTDLTYYKDELNELIVSNPEVRFVFIGYMPWMLDQTRSNLFVIPEKDTLEYFKVLGTINPNLCIVPLEDNIFNRCKSNIAWLETARFGTQTIAPNFEEWDRPGIINYLDYFFVTVQHNIDVCNKYSKGWQYIQDNLMLSDVNKKRVQLIEDLCS